MPTLATCPDLDALRQFSVGAVRESEAAGLEAHLASCPHCVETLHGIQGEDTLVEAMRAQSVLIARPRIDDAVTQLMVVLKGWNPTVSLHDAICHASDADEAIEHLAPPQQRDELGRLGAYRILRVLGSGGMGIVYEAEDTQLRRRVALKALRPLLAVSSMARKRFLREARAAAAVAHDHIVTIYQVGEAEGVPFLAMPYLAGETLEARLRREGPLPLGEVIRIGRELAAGLSAAHAQGLLHRDVKPANIWLENRPDGSNGRVKILDFGLAWVADDQGPLTDHGTVIGTPAYMAPEQARGEPADVRADLFSLGSVLYAMCTGQAPFQSPSNFATLEKVRTETPAPIETVNPAIPAWLVAIVTKLHAKNPAHRFQSADEVAAALQGNRRTARRKSRGWWAAAAALLFLPAIGLAVGEATGVTDLRQFFVASPQIVENREDDRPKPPPTPEVVPEPVNNEPKQQAPQPAAPTVYPAAIFTFEERGAGVKDYGAKVTDLLFAKLAAKPEINLVDRTDLKKILGELELNLSGAVKPADATKIGHLTGAKVLINGSVTQIDKKTYLIAKITGTETSRVFAASVDGKANDELVPLVEKLAEQIAKTIDEKGKDLVAKVVPKADRIANLKMKLKGDRPIVYVKIAERHIGAGKIDPAAQTEMAKFCKETGFTLIDPDEGLKARADVLIVGEAFSETATRTGNLVSVKARVEIKMIDRKTDKILAVDRQTALVVDLTENIAGKAAIQEAAASLAERMLPKLVK